MNQKRKEVEVKPPWSKMASNRDVFGDILLELGRENRNIVALNADLSGSTKTAVFAKEFPRRFFNAGVAEQSMMGMAAGLATTGKIVVASTFAVFATGRVYDFIRQSIAYPNLNVKIVASHAGITVGGDGATHQITEDISLMRVLPNMRVVVPADAIETERAFRVIMSEPGPFYFRFGRSASPVILPEDYNFELGKASVLRDGKDVTLAGCGVMVSRALHAAEILKGKDIDARVLNMSTIKPIDRDAIAKAGKETNGLVTCEEHSIIGGLGSAIAEQLVQTSPAPMRLLGIKDCFGESGDAEDLMCKFELTTGSIVKEAEALLKG
jgi:transketolase